MDLIKEWRSIMHQQEREQAFLAEWGDLAMYNAEVARGLVHTEEWKAKMAEKQVRYNARHSDGPNAPPYAIREEPLTRDEIDSLVILPPDGAGTLEP